MQRLAMNLHFVENEHLFNFSTSGTRSGQLKIIQAPGTQ